MENEKQTFSQKVQSRKEELYDRIPLTLKQVDIILWIAGIALAAVIVLIALEAMGIYSIWG